MDDGAEFSLVQSCTRKEFSFFQKSVSELLNGPDGISIAQWPTGHLNSRSIMSEPYYIPLI